MKSAGLSKFNQIILKINFILGGILLLVACYLYPRLPASVPTHLNVLGKFDGFGSKLTIFVLPLIIVVFGGVIAQPKIDQFFPVYSWANRLSKILLLGLILLLWGGAIYFFITYFQLLS